MHSKLKKTAITNESLVTFYGLDFDCKLTDYCSFALKNSNTFIGLIKQYVGARAAAYKIYNECVHSKSFKFVCMVLGYY